MTQPAASINPPLAAQAATGLLALMRGRYRAWQDLGKSRLSMMVVITAAVGYVVGTGLAVDWFVLFWLSVGTYLAAVSANAFNQCIEASRDARMERTAGRPLPSGRLGITEAVMVAFHAGVLGVGVLAVFCGWLPALLGLINIFLYVGVYTPLKTRSSLNTIVGAVVGGIPPMMGWAAATGGLETGAWLLGALLFVWQIPHFLALAWMYREDYARGGYRMLPAVDPEGTLTFRLSVLYAAALVPVTVAATLFGIAGWVFAIGATLLGVWMVIRGMTLAVRQDDGAARKLFLASLLYLPLVLALLVVDTRPTNTATTVAGPADLNQVDRTAEAVQVRGPMEVVRE